MNKLSNFYVCSALVIVGVFILSAPPFVHAQTTVDTDGDSITDDEERTVYRTDPLLSDTDGDGFSDSQEISSGYSPRHALRKLLRDVDSDNDGLSDAWEIALHTDLLNTDTDGDGFFDGVEVSSGYDPISARPFKIEKKIEVSLSKQRLSYAFGGITLEEFPISSGLPRTPTPLGRFTVLDKVPVKHYGGVGFDYPNTKWNLHFTTGQYRYYIHGAYWHNNFGNPMSHGCINVAYKNMERLYTFANLGTQVIIW